MNVKILEQKKKIKKHFPRFLVWTKVGRFIHLSSPKGRIKMKEVADKIVTEELKKGMFPHDEGIFPDPLIFREEIIEECNSFLEDGFLDEAANFFHEKMNPIKDDIRFLKERVSQLKTRISGFGSPRLQRELKDKIANYVEFVDYVQAEYDSLMYYWSTN
ncbi:hypothetical protein QL285_003258 [Trifolium repens]|nr:hypothetical protein QL285_003258 [Trifolium repens]